MVEKQRLCKYLHELLLAIEGGGGIVRTSESDDEWRVYLAKGFFHALHFPQWLTRLQRAQSLAAAFDANAAKRLQELANRLHGVFTLWARAAPFVSDEHLEAQNEAVSIIRNVLSGVQSTGLAELRKEPAASGSNGKVQPLSATMRPGKLRDVIERLEHGQPLTKDGALKGIRRPLSKLKADARALKCEGKTKILAMLNYNH